MKQKAILANSWTLKPGIAPETIPISCKGPESNRWEFASVRTVTIRFHVDPHGDYAFPAAKMSTQAVHILERFTRKRETQLDLTPMPNILH